MDAGVAEASLDMGSLTTQCSPLSSIYSKLKQEQARQKSRLSSIYSSPSKGLLQKDFKKELHNSRSDAIRQLRLQKASDLESLLAKAQARADRLLRSQEETKCACSEECSCESGSQKSLGSMLEELETHLDELADSQTPEPEAIDEHEQRLETALKTTELLRSEAALVHEQHEKAMARVVLLEALLREKEMAIEDKCASVEDLKEKIHKLQTDATLSKEKERVLAQMADDRNKQLMDEVQHLEEELKAQKELAAKSSILAETFKVNVRELKQQHDEHLEEFALLEALLKKKEMAIEDKSAMVEDLNEKIHKLQADTTLSIKNEKALAQVANDQNKELMDKVQHLEEELKSHKDLAAKSSILAETYEISARELKKQLDEQLEEVAQEKVHYQNAVAANAEELNRLGQIISQLKINEQSMQGSLGQLQDQLVVYDGRVEELRIESDQKTAEIQSLSSQLEEKRSVIQQLQVSLQKAPATNPLSSLQKAKLEANVKSEVEARFSMQVDELECLVSNLQKENIVLKRNVCDSPLPAITTCQTDSFTQDLNNETRGLQSELAASMVALENSTKELAEQRTQNELLQGKLVVMESVNYTRAPTKPRAIAAIEASIFVQRKKASFLLASGQSPDLTKACSQKLKELEQELVLAKEQSRLCQDFSPKGYKSEIDALCIVDGELNSRSMNTAEKAAEALPLSSVISEPTSKPNSGQISTALSVEEILDLQKRNEELQSEIQSLAKQLQTSKVELETITQQSELVKLDIALRDNDLQAKEQQIRDLKIKIEKALVFTQTVECQDQSDESAKASEKHQEETDRQTTWSIMNSRLVSSEAKIEDLLCQLDKARKEKLETSILSAVIDSLKQEAMEKEACIEVYEGKINSLEIRIEDLENQAHMLENTVAHCKKAIVETDEELEETMKRSKYFEERSREVDSLRDAASSQQEVLEKYKDKVIALETKLTQNLDGVGKLHGIPPMLSGNVQKRLLYVLALVFSFILAYFGLVKDEGQMNIKSHEKPSFVKDVSKTAPHSRMLSIPSMHSDTMRSDYHNLNETAENVPRFPVRPEISKISNNPFYSVIQDTTPSAFYQSANGLMNNEKFKLMKALRKLAVKSLDVSMKTARQVASHLESNSFQKHVDESSFDGLGKALGEAGNVVHGFIANELNPEKIRSTVYDVAYTHLADQLDPFLSPSSLTELASIVKKAMKQPLAGLKPLATVVFEASPLEYPSVHQHFYHSSGLYPGTDINKSAPRINRTLGNKTLDAGDLH